ncbi:MAG: sigma 54-interacting transcriptional regulator [Rhodobacteraceae bacterium]|jgi:transcriptional regulator with PAS, ATPase and Fis domain|nr:sigma 54-interacting transcriptional regulator [Paracoccaceae bacterium]
MTLDILDLRNRAQSSFFEIFEELAEGAIATDSASRIVWINAKYQKFLGIPASRNLVGRPIAEVIPGSLIPRVLDTGRPILLDLMEYDDRWCIVSRFPLFDTAGTIIGAFGFVLYDNLNEILPLMNKVRRLRTALSKAESNLRNGERRSRYSISQFIGTTPGVLEVKRQARAAALSNLPVVITGETGTGKEILAQAIHAASDRATGNFVAVNVAAIPEALLEVEFFGAAPGAYTGLGKQGRIGKMQLADGGTLFLDEVADMPPAIQTKLLRALQEREIEPLGGNAVVRIDVRVISATSRDLAALVETGQFRADLSYRLNTYPIRIPPLRERHEDIGALAEHMLEEIAARDGLRSISISPAAIRALQGHGWPGNVRELRNIVERIVLESGGKDIDLAGVRALLPQPAGIDPPRTARPIPLPRMAEALAALESDLMRAAMVQAGEDRARAAELLQMPRSTFYAKARQYGI